MGEAFDPVRALVDVESATSRLIATASRFNDGDLAKPSLCPGWTRGHVLAHVARNADSLVNLLTSARTGQEVAQYASADARNRDIEAGARRPLDVQLSDLKASDARFAEALARMPGDRWDAEIRWLNGRSDPARAIPSARLQEVEIHHVDLDAAYTPAHWPSEFVARMMATAVRRFSANPESPSVALVDPDGARWEVGAGLPVTVWGPQAALLAWLLGRSTGDGLTTDAAELPTLPAFA